ncbi:MAG: mechanosensitive ion channel [Desulfobulbaceae bacterium]|nr:mechanosensitive ion channel [Desulfobulbaceae bacterium]
MRKYLHTTFLVTILLGLVLPGYPVTVLALDQPQPPPPPSEQVIQGKIDELQLRLKGFSEAETPPVAQALNVTLEQLRERTEILQETQTYYNQQLQALRKHNALLKDQATLKETIATGEALKLPELPPYSLNFYDDYHARYADSKRNLETTTLALVVAENGLREARERLAAAAGQTRLLRAAEGNGKDQREKLLNQWLFQQGEREEMLAAAALAYHEQLLPNTQLEVDLATVNADLARQLSERIRDNLHFDQNDLDKQLALIELSRKELQDIVDGSRRDLRRASREVLNAQRRLEQAVGASSLATAKGALAVPEQWRQAYRIKLEQNEAIIQQLGLRKQLWKQRYELIKGTVKRAELARLRDEASKEQDSLRQRVTLEQERQTNLQLQIGKLEDRLQQDKFNLGDTTDLTEQRLAMMELVGNTIAFETALNKTAQMNLQFIEELDRALQTFSLTERGKVVFDKVRGWWGIELFVVDDQALTVRTVVIALTILTLGILLSGFFSNQIRKRLLAHLWISSSAAAITSKLIHYTVVLVVIIVAMRLVNIPLTAFTFMGGAIALGVGFGAQKLINNFISGFILMAEQPVKVGDLIMLDDNPGWIEEIGARSTRVRTFANTNILVPNSYFLENNIVNWTHNDNVVRGKIAIGMAYSSQTRQVKEALLRTAAEHGEVLESPEPYVWFADFAANALLFELYFWVRVTEHISVQMVASDLRFMIDQQFRGENISIAFPQLDVHFDRESPLKAEISRPGK